MRKSKHFAKSTKKAQKSAEPETEIDFLEMADEQEKGGSKWRAGDAVKATRFFARALDIYNTGLERYPDSFDLAYNKAHLTFQLFQDERISPNLGDRVQVLEGALEAHRYALRLNEDNPDILFNTAQVLTSLAEESGDVSDHSQKENVVQLLQEAVELFSSCLDRQEMLLYEFQHSLEGTNSPTANAAPSSASASATSPPASSGVQWATVEEPVTSAVILDTAIAMLACLEGLLAASVPAESSALAAISEIASPLIHTKIPSFVSLIPESALEEAREAIHLPTLSISSTSSATFTPGNKSQKPRNPRFEAKMEAGLAIASFQTTIAETEYRSNLSTLDTFSSRIQDSYEPIMSERKISMKTLTPQEITPQDVETAVAYAEAYNNSLGPAEAESDGTMTTARAEIMLKAMLRTDELLSWTLATFDNSRESMPVSKRAQIQLLCGDMALRTSRVMKASNSQGNGASQYVFRADKFYQSAAETAKTAIAGVEGHESKAVAEETRAESLFKSLLTATVMTMEFQGFKTMAERLVGRDQAGEFLDNVVREGLMDKSLAYTFWQA